MHTGLLGEARSDVWRVFSRAGINVEHKKRVYLYIHEERREVLLLSYNLVQDIYITVHNQTMV